MASEGDSHPCQKTKQKKGCKGTIESVILATRDSVGGVSLRMQELLIHLVVKSSEASIVSMRYSVNMCLLTDGCGKSGTSSLKSTM